MYINGCKWKAVSGDWVYLSIGFARHYALLVKENKKQKTKTCCNPHLNKRISPNSSDVSIVESIFFEIKSQNKKTGTATGICCIETLLVKI